MHSMSHEMRHCRIGNAQRGILYGMGWYTLGNYSMAYRMRLSDVKNIYRIRFSNIKNINIKNIYEN